METGFAIVLVVAALAAGLFVGFVAGRARTRARVRTSATATGTVAGMAAGRPAPDARTRGELRAPAEMSPAGDERRPGAMSPTGDGRPDGGPRETAHVLELAGIGALAIEPDLTVGAANDSAARLLGRRPGSLAGRSVMEAFTDHHVEAALRAALDAGAAEGEITIRGRVATTLVFRARRTDRGGLLVVLSDVSELRRLQHIRTEFIDNISHELRTPITTVSLLAETLSLGAAQLPPKTAERIEKIRVETDHLVTMVNELLDLSRIESGGGSRLVVDEVDLGRLVRATVDRIGHFAERAGVALEVVIPADLPAVHGDAERLGQALLNLVHNAVKFSPTGAAVTVRVMPSESEAVVVVEDHGPGIPRAALPRVFERFYKVDRARTRGAGGTGLGLSIARHIVDAHGGRIWVDSVEGAGATFAFAIPLGGPDLADSAGG